jgi:hypothetical protein
MTKFILVSALLLAGCREQRPPAPTAQQSEQLNDAADMLDNVGNEEGPEQRPGPSNRVN